MSLELLPLPYPSDAFGEIMSAETFAFHHGKHHQAYVDKVNGLLEDTEASGASLVETIKTAHHEQNRLLFNNSAQIWNHNFFWQCLAPPTGQKPAGRLAQLIDDSFGSVDALLAKLQEEAVSHFSNGWAWLILDHDTLKITSLHDADTPVVHDAMTPLLTLDVWEHAYYIDYRNARAAFANSVLGNAVNWEFVAQNLDGTGIARANQSC